MTKPLYVRSGKRRVWHLVGRWEGRRVLSNTPAFPYCRPSLQRWPEHTESPDRVCKNCSKEARRSLRQLAEEVEYLEAAVKDAEVGCGSGSRRAPYGDCAPGPV